MGRGDPDPLPPIEIVGAAPAAESLQRVTTGPGGPRRTSGRAVAVAVGVVLLVLGGLALSDDSGGSPESADKELRDNSAKLPLKRTTTTRPRSTTTRPPTTTTTRPVGPVFGSPVGAGLLVYGSYGWVLVDLDTGGRTPLDLPVTTPYEAVVVTGGVVMIASDTPREAAFYGIGPGGDLAEPVALGPADQVLPAGPDRVWLIDGGGRVNEGGGFASPVADVRLVDLDGEASRSFEIEASYVSQAVAAGIVVDRGGRIYLADEHGTHPVAVGWTSGVIEDDLLTVSCDDDAVCGVYRQPVDGRGATRLYVADDPDDLGVGATSAADGRIALTVWGGGGDQRLILLEPDGRRLGTSDEVTSSSGGTPRWLPDGRGLLLPDMGMRWIHERDGAWVSEEVPALTDLPAELAYVIEW